MGDETDEMQRSWAGVRLDGRVRRRPSDARGRRPRPDGRARCRLFQTPRAGTPRGREVPLRATRKPRASARRDRRERNPRVRPSECILGVLAREMRVERLSGASRPSRPDPGSVKTRKRTGSQNSWFRPYASLLMRAVILSKCTGSSRPSRLMTYMVMVLDPLQRSTPACARSFVMTGVSWGRRVLFFQTRT